MPSKLDPKLLSNNSATYSDITTHEGKDKNKKLCQSYSIYQIAWVLNPFKYQQPFQILRPKWRGKVNSWWYRYFCCDLYIFYTHQASDGLHHVARHTYSMLGGQLCTVHDAK